MGNRFSDPTAILGVLLVTASLGAQPPQDNARPGSAAQRAADQIKALQRESDELALKERSLLVDLRKLEVERELKTAELARIARTLSATDGQIKEITARATALQVSAEAERPDVEARLVQIYKNGHAGYWRMLLAVDDLRSVGRAYRTAAALTRIDRDRVQQHARTLQALADQRKALQAKAADMAKLQAQAAAARAAIDRAVAARTALVESIDARRDLNAQLTGELEAAAHKLQGTVADLGRSANVALPLRPFRGALAWPAPGIVIHRFGRPSSGRGATASSNGIELSLAEGQPVHAVHEGTVAFADQFTGYGNLVILDHGDGAFSLYGHLSSLAVAKGNKVDAQATVGASGRNPSGNPALYFELRVDGKPVDPLQWLRKQP